ncbi:MAG: Asp-tRNA(Asn)/Glu-tRNA(Gln) amidotransferase subunit GatA, partial [Terriglobia bacterium]
MDLTTLTISGLQEQLRSDAVTARQVTERHLARIQQRAPAIRAYLAVSPERARAQADAIDRRVQAKQPLPP